MRSSLCLPVLLGLCSSGQALATELTGRFSMLGATAQAGAGDWGYSDTGNNALSADQQSLRLMLDGHGDNAEWSAHLRSLRLHSHGIVSAATHSSALFRYTELGGELLDESDGTSSTRVHYELDRFYYRHQFRDYSASIGRQAIDWGSGRFWQPLNVFGSFSPTELDTDYKPGIDTVVAEYFPSPYSSVTAVYALAPEQQGSIKNSGALHYRSQVGALSEMTLLAGSITGNTVFGGSFESAWNDLGWRIEGLHYSLRESDEQALFWIAGMDYQFDDGTLLSAEYYDNSRGGTSSVALSGAFSDELIATGLQQHLSRQLIGVALSRDVTSLLHASYTLLGAPLAQDDGAAGWSCLQQLNLSYSVSNESDLLASLVIPSGKGLSVSDEPQSEFGHIPMMFTLRLRFYF